MIYETNNENKILLTGMDDYTYNDYSVELVVYDNKLEEANLFELLGMLNPGQLFSWLTAPDGRKK